MRTALLFVLLASTSANAQQQAAPDPAINAYAQLLDEANNRLVSCVAAGAKAAKVVPAAPLASPPAAAK